jgi:hypothetical protein
MAAGSLSKSPSTPMLSFPGVVSYLDVILHTSPLGKSNLRFSYLLGGMRPVRSLLCVAAAGLL